MPGPVESRLFWAWLAVLACIVAGCRKPHADAALLVFAAASTSDALGDVGRDFEHEAGAKVSFSFGASRDLARQIRAGAPADVFVSADAETVDVLVAEKLVRTEERRPLMSNRLVVIVPRESGRALRGPADLKDVATIALGDPATVPAGSYAKKWLERAGLWKELEDRVVPTLDVRAALAAVEAGRADAGIVYRTDAATSQRARIVYEVPPEALPPITYVAAIIARSTQPSASAFLDFLTGPHARATLARHGFVL
jgi:molybdate transport system substrate-binding protein